VLVCHGYPSHDVIETTMMISLAYDYHDDIIVSRFHMTHWQQTVNDDVTIILLDHICYHRVPRFQMCEGTAAVTVRVTVTVTGLAAARW
jgi:hypothetical protein